MSDAVFLLQLLIYQRFDCWILRNFKQISNHRLGDKYFAKDLGLSSYQLGSRKRPWDANRTLYFFPLKSEKDLLRFEFFRIRQHGENYAFLSNSDLTYLHIKFLKRRFQTLSSWRCSLTFLSFWTVPLSNCCPFNSKIRANRMFQQRFKIWTWGRASGLAMRTVYTLNRSHFTVTNQTTHRVSSFKCQYFESSCFP